MRVRRVLMLTMLAALAWGGAGCRSACSTTRVCTLTGKAATPAPPFALHLRDWRTAVAGHPMAPEDNIVVTPLGRTESASHHLVRVRDREPIHIHAKHDLTVFVLAGDGRILLDSEEYPCLPGEVLQIPKGQVHAFINAGREPAVAYVIFSPPFDGQDRVIVPRPTVTR